MSAIFQCFLTAKYPITAANTKPTGIIKIPILSIPYILQLFYAYIKFDITYKNCYRCKYKNKSKEISIYISLLYKADSICAKSTSNSYHNNNLLVESINNLCKKINFFFRFRFQRNSTERISYVIQ